MGDLGDIPPLLSIAKTKKGNKGKKSFEEEAIKRLRTKSLRTKCYCFCLPRASRTQNCFFSANYGHRQNISVFDCSSTLKSISPTLLNQLPSTRFSLMEYHQPPESWAYPPPCYFTCSSSILPPKCLFSNFHTVFGHFGKNVCPQQLTLIGKPWSTYTSHAPKLTRENNAFRKVNAHPVF